MRIFLTGGTGFIGSYFLKLALAAGHEIVALRLPGTVPVVPTIFSAIDNALIDWKIHLNNSPVSPVAIIEKMNILNN